MQYVPSALTAELKPGERYRVQFRNPTEDTARQGVLEFHSAEGAVLSWALGRQVVQTPIGWVIAIWETDMVLQLPLPFRGERRVY